MIQITPIHEGPYVYCEKLHNTNIFILTQEFPLFVQRIFRLINKGAVSIGCELFQDCLNGLEIDGIFTKRRGVKMLPFLLIP